MVLNGLNVPRQKVLDYVEDFSESVTSPPQLIVRTEVFPLQFV